VTPRDRDLVAALCAERAGLAVDPAKAYLLENRLAPVARREGFSTLHEFVQRVRDRGDERLVWAIVEAMAPCESGFFRDPAAFETIGSDLLLDLALRRSGGPVRIWAAACGAGQEAYSLAMLLQEKAPAGAAFELYGSDLNERRLEKAQAGMYSQFEVQRGLSARRLISHFEKRDDAFVLSPRLRQTVRWRRVNLLQDLRALGAFDLVLCRNVLGAYTDAARTTMLANLAAVLAPQGYLVLGSGERAPGLYSRPDRPGVFSRPQPPTGAAIGAAA
jgi:chemotaxis protein methyltransferase CheR